MAAPISREQMLEAQVERLTEEILAFRRFLDLSAGFVSEPVTKMAVAICIKEFERIFGVIGEQK